MKKHHMITADSTGKNDSEADISTATMDRRTSPETNGMSSVSAARLNEGSDDGLGGCDGLMSSRRISNKDEIASKPETTVPVSTVTSQKRRKTKITRKKPKRKEKNPYTRQARAQVCPDTKVDATPFELACSCISDNIQCLLAILRIPGYEVFDMNECIGFKLLRYRAIRSDECKEVDGKDIIMAKMIAIFVLQVQHIDRILTTELPLTQNGSHLQLLKKMAKKKCR